MKKQQSLVLLCGLFLSFFARAQCPPPPEPSAEQIQALAAKAQDRGFLWRISKDGQASWLYGTIHINRLESLMPGPKTRQALQQSDAIVLELDPTDAETQQQLATLGQRGAGQIPRQYQERIKKQMDAVCLPTEMMDKLHPALLFTTLETLGAREQGYELGYGAEYVLVSVAQAGKKKLIALETAQEQMEAMLGPDAKVTPTEIKLALEQIESGKNRQLISRQVDAWASSDWPTIARFLEWCDCQNTAEERAAMKRLLDDRNRIMADRIAKLNKKGQMLFIAVGSLHMAGAQGLPNLLRKRGYQVEQIPLR